MKRLCLIYLLFFTSCTASYYFYDAVENERKGQMQEAERLYMKSCNMGEPAACNNLGVINIKRGDKGSALDLYRRACNYNTNPIGCQNLAGMYKDYRMGNYNEAMSAANFACKNNMEIACKIVSTMRARQSKFINDALKGAVEYNKINNQ